MQASDLSAVLPECCAEVLESMYFTTVLDAASPCALLPAWQGEGLAYGLRFRGDIHGSFGLTIGYPMARTLAANFLGEQEEALTEAEVAEVVGELTNMLCGSVVSRMECSTTFALSHPEPLLALPAGDDLLTAKFDTDSGTLHTWITIDPPLPGLDHVADEHLQAAH